LDVIRSNTLISAEIPTYEYRDDERRPEYLIPSIFPLLQQSSIEGLIVERLLYSDY